MKLIEKLALEHVEKATHPEGDPHFRRAIKATWEAGFRAAREMAADILLTEGDDQTEARMILWIKELGEKEA